MRIKIICHPQKAPWRCGFAANGGAPGCSLYSRRLVVYDVQHYEVEWQSIFVFCKVTIDTPTAGHHVVVTTYNSAPPLRPGLRFEEAIAPTASVRLTTSGLKVGPRDHHHGLNST